MARVRYTEQLDDLRDQLAGLFSETAARLAGAVRALLEGDLSLAEATIAADDDVDARVLAVEEQCFAVLALQSPVAGGLRRVLAAMRIAAEASRSGDLVANIGKAARRLYGHRIPTGAAAELRRMSDLACLMLAETADACVRADGSRLGVLREMDQDLDAAQASLLATLFEGGSEPQADPQVVIQLAVVGRFLERLGDHAVNAAERVAYAAGTAVIGEGTP